MKNIGALILSAIVLNQTAYGGNFESTVNELVRLQKIIRASSRDAIERLKPGARPAKFIPSELNVPVYDATARQAKIIESSTLEDLNGITLEICRRTSQRARCEDMLEERWNRLKRTRGSASEDRFKMGSAVFNWLDFISN